jgi:tRNA threonylcarbamoyladenosine biosynthesis protein TsaB
MKILALEFSSPRRSVACWNPETGVTTEVVDPGEGYTPNPFALIESALHQAKLVREQIEVVVVGSGPGSYTGIRAAMALAQGWQLARGTKVSGISSADCLATEAAAENATGRIHVVIDAQRGEFYLGTYEIVAALPKVMAPLRIVSSETIQECERLGEMLIGPEVAKWFPNGRQAFPRAATLARMASSAVTFVPGEKLEPIYLRETTFVKAASPRRGPDQSASQVRPS